MPEKKFLTEEQQAQFLEALRLGAYTTTACKLVRLDRTVFHGWRKEKREPWASFMVEVEQAEAEGEMFHIKALHDATEKKGDGDWRASEAFLKRRHGDRWNRGWSPVEAEAPDKFSDIESRLRDPKKTAEAAEVVEKLVDGPDPASALVSGWVRSGRVKRDMDSGESPPSPKPRTPRGRRRTNDPADSGDAA